MTSHSAPPSFRDIIRQEEAKRDAAKDRAPAAKDRAPAAGAAPATPDWVASSLADARAMYAGLWTADRATICTAGKMRALLDPPALSGDAGDAARAKHSHETANNRALMRRIEVWQTSEHLFEIDPWGQLYLRGTTPSIPQPVFAAMAAEDAAAVPAEPSPPRVVPSPVLDDAGPARPAPDRLAAVADGCGCFLCQVTYDKWFVCPPRKFCQRFRALAPDLCEPCAGGANLVFEPSDVDGGPPVLTYAFCKSCFHVLRNSARAKCGCGKNRMTTSLGEVMGRVCISCAHSRRGRRRGRRR